jgi:hypothetical protein
MRRLAFAPGIAQNIVVLLFGSFLLTSRGPYDAETLQPNFFRRPSIGGDDSAFPARLGAKEPSSAMPACRPRANRTVEAELARFSWHQPQNLSDQFARHRDFRHLERDVACSCDDLGPDLDELFPQAGQRPVRISSNIADWRR